ncbi:hypothetical protein PX554_26165 [Sphingomonas sp. H39-1-10]|uniref:phage protein n=1 Tax=Sphingomonas pollutisoli TaxID=3030829 RepID=UPI0023B9CBA7|nr:hypothetical protein [Sphingomonas pollutisoli]MDF0491604.1 hypothetical protein [Sphingomonas pollutisoli]
MENYKFYIRKATLLLGDDQRAIDLSQLHYKFSVKMADVTHPQYAVFRIYNMSDDTKAQIKANEYRKILFSAGYENGQFGTIFDGEVIQGLSGRESPVDTYLELLCAVGHSSYQAGMNQTLAAGASSGDVAQAAAAAMGRPLLDQSTDNGVKMPRGQVLYGPAHEVLTTAATESGATWHYEASGVAVIDAQKPKAGDDIPINMHTGMVGWPLQTQEGVNVRCLLNPRIAVGLVIDLYNSSIQQAQISPARNFVNTLPKLDPGGKYKVYYFEHSGDTRGNEWYTDIIGLSLSNAGGLSTLYQRGLS